MIDVSFSNCVEAATNNFASKQLEEVYCFLGASFESLVGLQNASFFVFFNWSTFVEFGRCKTLLPKWRASSSPFFFCRVTIMNRICCKFLELPKFIKGPVEFFFSWLENLEVLYDKKWTTITIKLPSDVAPQKAKVELNFTGELNDKMRGFYRSMYKDGKGEEKYIASTQFEVSLRKL